MSFTPYTRNYPISEVNHRKLVWLTKANNATVDGLDVPGTASQLCNGILEDFFEKFHPQLGEFIEKRASIDSEAIESLKKS